MGHIAELSKIECYQIAYCTFFLQDVVGFYFPDSAKTSVPPPDLEAFLSGGDAPIYCATQSVNKLHIPVADLRSSDSVRLL